jgi:hypothetical protein
MVARKKLGRPCDAIENIIITRQNNANGLPVSVVQCYQLRHPSGARTFSTYTSVSALGSIGAAFIFVRPIGSDSAFMTGFAAGLRNVGLVAAAQSGSLPDLAWLYFALVQLPIYLTPPLLRRTISFQQQKSDITESKRSGPRNSDARGSPRISR